MEISLKELGFPSVASKVTLSDEYYYQSLPLCVLDAVFSMGVRYESTRNVVKRFCLHAKVQRIRSSRNQIPQASDQFGISDYLKHYGNTSPEKLASDVFQNVQRTSTQNGILKAEAAGHFMKELAERKVEYLQDLPKLYLDLTFEKAIKTIPGQKSGISLQYFFMLAGDNNLIKPDRMILRFLERTFPNRKFNVQQATSALQDICKCMKMKWGIDITPRELDHWIWRHER